MSRILAVVREGPKVVKEIVGLANAIRDLQMSRRGYEVAVDTLTRSAVAPAQVLHPGRGTPKPVCDERDQATVCFLLQGGLIKLHKGLADSENRVRTASGKVGDALAVFKDQWRVGDSLVDYLALKILAPDVLPKR